MTLEQACVRCHSGKDIPATLAALKGKVDYWHLADLAVPRGATAAALKTAVAGLGGEVFCHADPAEGYRKALEQAADNDRILVFGSFYTVADVLRLLAQRRSRG